MKNRRRNLCTLPVAVFVLLFLFLQSAFSQPLYNNTIQLKPETYNSVKNAVDDLQQYLGKATGTQFTVDTKSTNSATGIQIIQLGYIADSSYDKRLNRDNADEALIQSDGAHYLKIIAYTRQGLINGIYTYLDTLGFRWYHPGDSWTYVPQLKDIRFKYDQVLIPDFALRTFFGTWGTPRNKVVDPKAIVDGQWQVWATRNRMGGAYALKGHSWNEFLWRNFSALNDNREYDALVDGERVKPNTATKFCISNKKFQELFVADMVAQLKKIMATTAGSIFTVSVEPSDGGGFCECDQCAKFGGISNQVFFLANLVAKEFQKISPNAYVNLYAYNTHAAPPDFELEKNVIVQIIPYGYQHFSSPEEMMRGWKQKGHKLFIYDYYGLPINNIDMPLQDDLKPVEFAKRIKFWHEQHIMGATLESSYSIGATGIGLFLFARLGWNVNSDVNKILDEYYKHCYGDAANAVRKSQQILSADTIDRTCALARSMQVLQKQTAKLKLEEPQKTCLTDYKAYLHYLKLLYNVQKEDAKIEPLASDSLMRYTYSIFQTMMVHQFPISEYLKMHGPSQSYIKQYWDGFNPASAGMKFSSVVQLTNEQINESFDGDCKEIKE